MSKLFTHSILLLLCAIGATAASAEQAMPFTPREGIPNVARKLKAGEPLSVVFLGGSITANGSGFTGQVPQWLRQSYPSSTIRVTNAGVSGTPSRFGAQRMDRDVLSSEPDLIFVEFAVNDGTADATEHMERIVRKARTKNPHTDIVFIYTLNANTHLPDYKAGRLPPAAASHERVAAHYGIPTIGMAYEAAAQIDSAALSVAEFAPDKIHPSPRGYAIYTDAITSALAQMINAHGQMLNTHGQMANAHPQMADAHNAGTHSADSSDTHNADNNTAAGPAAHAMPQPLSPDFVLYPEPTQAEPLPEAAPLLAADGRRSVSTFPAPVPGKHWMGESVYTLNGQPLWEMLQIPYERSQQPEPATGLNSAQWKPTDWFAQGSCFTGSVGTHLWGLGENGAPLLATATLDLPALAFIAPVDGEYAFSVRSGTMGYFGPPTRTACFSVAQLRWGETNATPVASQTLVKQDNASLNLSGTVHLRAGEKLVFIVSKDSPSRVQFPQFELTVGLLPQAQ